MSAETWGLMPKSQEDDKTVEERITEMIGAHEADSESHLGAGESLQTHKSEETIDHPEDSVITDKIPPNAIETNQLNFLPSSQLIDWAYVVAASITKSSTASYTNTRGEIVLTTGTTTNNYIQSENYIAGAGINFAIKNIYMTTQYDIDNYQNQLVYVGIGNFNNSFVGLKIINDILYLGTIVAGVHHFTQIETFFPRSKHRLRIEHLHGISEKFYLDDVLVLTQTNYLATGTGYYLGSYFYVKTTNTTSKDLTINNTTISQSN